MTLREQLAKQFERDCSKAPKKYWNIKDKEMRWDVNEKIYISVDESGKEWIAALQHTRVPIFSVTCSNTQRKGNIEIECGGINLVPIFKDEETIKCHVCNKEFPVKLNINPTSVSYKTWKRLDK